MKRSSSDIDRPSSASVSSHQSDDFKPEITPPPTKSRAKKATPKKAKQEGSGSHDGGGNGEWTSEKKGMMMDAIIAAGYKFADLDRLAAQLGLSKRQIVNQLTPGRKGSLREKAVQAVGKQ